MRNGLIYNNQIEEKNSLKEWIMYILIQFPISSMLKVYVGELNLLLTGLLFLLFFIYYLRNRISKIDFFVCAYIVLTILYNLAIWGMNYYEINMLFYFPFLLIYFCFFIRNKDYILAFLLKHKQYIDIVLIIWNGMVLISFFFPSSYIYEGETMGFVSFAGSTFLLCAMAIYIFALLIFQSYIYKRKIYAISLLIPSLCILMGTTRTYIIVLLCAWLIFVYVNMKHKKLYIFFMLIGMIIFAMIVTLSPISEKFIDVSTRSDNLGLDPLEAFTSGRSVFWVYDIKEIFQNSIFRIIFGNGVNWIFIINKWRFHNPLWAHNDFIQILSDYGLIGLGIYIWCFKHIIKNFTKSKNISKILIVILIIMWAFNAFFNMFYTYFCVVLSFPVFLLIIYYDAQLRQLSLNKVNDEKV